MGKVTNREFGKGRCGGGIGARSTAISGRCGKPPAATMVSEGIGIGKVKRLRHSVQIGANFRPYRGGAETRVECLDNAMHFIKQHTGQPAIDSELMCKVAACFHAGIFTTQPCGYGSRVLAQPAVVTGPGIAWCALQDLVCEMQGRGPIAVSLGGFGESSQDCQTAPGRVIERLG